MLLRYIVLRIVAFHIISPAYTKKIVVTTVCLAISSTNEIKPGSILRRQRRQRRFF